jgi:sugar lactone lactonase YvrE
MHTSRITSISPSGATPGGRVAILGSNFRVGPDQLPDVTIGTEPARTVFASPSEIAVMVTTTESGPVTVQVDGAVNTGIVQIGAMIATGLHQVDSPVFDASGNLYLTYSGSRGQQVPVSIFRVAPGGTRESFSSSITNPTGMAVSPSGDIFVSSRFEGAIYRLLDDGSAETFATDLGVPCGLAFADDGTLFVGDRSGTIFEVSREGRARTLATLPPSVAAFHLARAGDALYITAPTLSAQDVIYRVALDGQVSVHQRGFGRPQGLAVTPGGALYVVEALAGVSGLYRVEPDRAAALVISGPRLVGIAFDPRGGMVVCSADTVYRFGKLPAA